MAFDESGLLSDGLGWERSGHHLKDHSHQRPSLKRPLSSKAIT
jgi:hypothetical protein